MRKQILCTLFRVHFGKGAARPLRAASARLLTATVVAVMFCVALHEVLQGLSAFSLAPSIIQGALVMLLGFVVGGVVLLVQQSQNNDIHGGNSFGVILYLLPLHKRYRWLAHVFPGYVVLTVIALFGVLLIAQLPTLQTRQMLLLQASLILSLLSVHGLMLLPRPVSIVRKTIVFVGLIGLASALLDRSLQSGLNEALAVSSVTVLLVPLTGQYVAVPGSYQATARQRTETMRTLLFMRVPLGFWMLVKLYRNARIRSAFLVVLCINSALALFILYRKNIQVEAFGLVLVSASLAATIAADVRGLLARYQPPEYVVVGGLHKALRTQVATSALCAIVCGLPLSIVLLVHTTMPVLFMGYAFALHVAAAAVGQVCGAIFVPSSGDTGNQFFAGILSMLLMAFVPRLLKFEHQAYSIQSFCWLLIGGALLSLMVIIEELRRKQYGHA